jgi:hypothetical protein
MIASKAGHMIAGRSPNWLERSIELALHGVVIGFFAKVFEPTQELSSAGKSAWIIHISTAFLCLFTLLYYINLVRLKKTSSGLNLWVALSAPVVLVMLLQGLYEFPNVDILHTLCRGVPWVAFVFLPSLGAPDFRPRLNKILKWHAFLGVIVCIGVLAANWGNFTGMSVVRQEGMKAKQGKALLYPIYFLLFKFKTLPLFLKSLTGVGILILAIQAVASATRQAVLLLAMSLVLGAWTYLRVKAMKGRLGVFVTSTIVAFMIIVAALNMMPLLSGALQMTYDRFTIESGHSSLKENDRLNELRTFFLHRATPLDYLFGRGVNGKWLHISGAYSETMHIGYGRYTLKGGVPMVMLLIFGPFITGLRIFLLSRSPEVLASAGMCVWFGVKNFTGSFVGAHPQFFLILICFGICLFTLDENRKKKMHPAFQEKLNIHSMIG